MTDNPITCGTCGKVLEDKKGPVIEHPLDEEEDIWFTAEESPTGKPICGACFDKLPCEDCKGL